MDKENAEVPLCASQLLLKRARLLLAHGALEPTDRFNDECVRDLTSCARLRPPKPRDPIGDVARELLIGMHARRREYAEAGGHAEALLTGVLDLRRPGAEGELLDACHAVRAPLRPCASAVALEPSP